mgnify:CR=1 FL=1
MLNTAYTPPWWLSNGLAMTLYTAYRGETLARPALASPLPYQPQVFIGALGTPIYGLIAIPPNAHSTVVATYGITGSLDNQWFLHLLAQKAYAQGYAIALFDWRAHGQTAVLSPALTSDGIYEGEDFVRIAAAAKQLGCPAPFWFTAYSLGGQLVFWAIKAAQTLDQWGTDLELTATEIAGGAVICPSLESTRSFQYLQRSAIGRRLEQAIARQLQRLAWQLHEYHPTAIAAAAIDRIHDIWSFDQELVIESLGFDSVAAYYQATSGLYQLSALQKPTLILYAADDPLFDPMLIPELQASCAANPYLDLCLTQQGGHVGYLSSRQNQRQLGDRDGWWAWNRVLDWIAAQPQTRTPQPLATAPCPP